MELKNVKLVEKKQVESGTTKAGKNWKKQLIIVEETNGQYPKQVALTVWNEMVDKMTQKNVHDVLDCGIKIESRQYNERWYTDVTAYAIDKAKAGKDFAQPGNDLPF